MNNLKLCESDYRFMRVVWQNEPVPSGELVKLCAKELGWKKPTTYTTLKKLAGKGFLQNVDTIVTSLVPMDQVQPTRANPLWTAPLPGRCRILSPPSPKGAA